MITIFDKGASWYLGGLADKHGVGREIMDRVRLLPILCNSKDDQWGVALIVTLHRSGVL